MSILRRTVYGKRMLAPDDRLEQKRERKVRRSGETMPSPEAGRGKGTKGPKGTKAFKGGKGDKPFKGKKVSKPPKAAKGQGPEGEERSEDQEGEEVEEGQAGLSVARGRRSSPSASPPRDGARPLVSVPLGHGLLLARVRP